MRIIRKNSLFKLAHNQRMVENSVCKLFPDEYPTVNKFHCSAAGNVII